MSKEVIFINGKEIGSVEDLIEYATTLDQVIINLTAEVKGLRTDVIRAEEAGTMYKGLGR